MNCGSRVKRVSVRNGVATRDVANDGKEQRRESSRRQVDVNKHDLTMTAATAAEDRATRAKMNLPSGRNGDDQHSRAASS